MRFDPPRGRDALAALGTLVAAGLGGWLFFRLNLPAAWISGALVVTSLLALGGARVSVPESIRFVSFIILGASMGTALTPEAFAGAALWPVTMMCLALSVAASMGGAVLFLMRVSGWSLETAFFAAAPGALTAVMAMAAETTADERRVAFAQALRLFLLVAALPALLEAGAPPPPAAVAATSSAADVAVMLAVSMLAGLATMRLRVPGGLIIGAMVGSAGLHASGLSHAVVPPVLLVPSFVVLGAGVGTRFLGTSLAHMREFLVASLGAFVVAVSLSVACALLAARLGGQDPGMVITAFAPGALEAMTSLGFALGYDPAFLVAHHMFRFGLLTLALPVLGHMLFARKGPR